MSNPLHKLEVIVIYALAVLLPIFILPVFPNAFVIPKILLLVVGLASLFVIKTLQLLYYKESRFTVGLFDFSVLLLAVSYAASTIWRSPNKMEALLFPGTATIIVGGALLYFFVNNLEEKNKRQLKSFLVLGGVISAVVSLFATAGILNSLGILPQGARGQSFSLMGGTLASFVYLIALIPISIGEVITQKDMARKAFFGVAGVLLVFGIILSALDVFSSTEVSTQLPGFQPSWVVAVDSLKEKPLFGVGAGNYLTAYNRFRPIAENQGDMWATRFTSSRSMYLHIVTEAGLLGIAAVVFLLLSVFGLFRKASKGGEMTLSETFALNDTFGSLVLLLLLFIVFPAFASTLMLMFFLLGSTTKGKSIHLNAGASEGLHFPPIVFAVPLLLAVVAVGYFGGRMAIAESLYSDAVTAVRKNDGKGSYDKLREAIEVNPYVDRYRATYGQINLLLAVNLAQKKDLTDQERQTISQLVQQAIREGKATVVLNPERSSNWESLAGIYRTIIPLAKGADVFAVQTYSQAVALDPGNINSRIAIGGVFYQAKNYEAAIRSFELAVTAKPNHANARYNLALAYNANGNFDRAIVEMERVLQILPQDSKDYETAKKQLEDIKAKKPATPATGTEIKNEGAPQAPDLEPDVELGQEENPPAPQVTPTPAPQNSPTPVPTVAPTATPQP